MCYFSKGKEGIVPEIFHFSVFERHCFIHCFISSGISSKKVRVKEITEITKTFNKSIVCFRSGCCVQYQSPALTVVAVEMEEVQRPVT